MTETKLLSHFDLNTGTIAGRPTLVRRLSDLKGSFADDEAYEAALKIADPVLYTVASVEPAAGPGQLHYGLGVIMPGKVGHEYYLTKGHFHSWREAAEIYFGLGGSGLMLLENEATGEASVLPLTEGSAVYVPGHTAHRTINTGTVPLSYIGVYPSEAGHDYGSIGSDNFGKIVLERQGEPFVLDRQEYASYVSSNR